MAPLLSTSALFLAGNVALASALKLQQAETPRIESYDNASMSPEATRVDTPRCGLGPDLVAGCCDTIYNNSLTCGCWEKKWVHHVEYVVRAMIFQDETGPGPPRCLLGFSGQLDGDVQWDRDKSGYILDHDVWAYRTLCERKTVRGFAVKAQKFFRSAGWEGGAKFLASEKCAGGVSITGTSLGAVMSEIVAGCANRGLLSELQGDHLPTFKIQTVTTFGAPPTALSPIEDVTQKNGCLPGYRVFRASNTSAVGASDLVSYSTRLHGFVHAKQAALQLIEVPGGGFDVRVLPCEDDDTPSQPNWWTIQPYLKKQRRENGDLNFVASTIADLKRNHRIHYYADDMEKVPQTRFAELAPATSSGLPLDIQKWGTGGPPGERHKDAGPLNISSLEAKTAELMMRLAFTVLAPV